MDRIPISQITVGMLEAAAKQANPSKDKPRKEDTAVFSTVSTSGIKSSAVTVPQPAPSLTQSSETLTLPNQPITGIPTNAPSGNSTVVIPLQLSIDIAVCKQILRPFFQQALLDMMNNQSGGNLTTPKEAQGIVTTKPDGNVPSADEILSENCAEGWESIHTMDLNSLFWCNGGNGNNE